MGMVWNTVGGWFRGVSPGRVAIRANFRAGDPVAGFVPDAPTANLA